METEEGFSSLCNKDRGERSVIYHVEEDFPLSNLLLRLAHRVKTFVWSGTLKIAPQLKATNIQVSALYSFGERKNVFQVNLGKELFAIYEGQKLLLTIV